MTVQWVIQTNSVDKTQADAVAHAVNLAGGRVIEARVYPATKTIEFPDRQPEGWCVVPYGTTKLVQLSLERGWGAFYNDNFKTTVWNRHRSDLLNPADSSLTPNEVRMHFYPIDHRPESRYFIRPVAGLKQFNGTIGTLKEIHQWMQELRVGKYAISPDTLVSISKVKNIKAEWRWFVVGGRVIDGSVYRSIGQRVNYHERNEAIKQRAQAMADIWLPHQNCVMDIALTDDGHKVVEFNCLNSSGFYNHDIPKIVNAVSAWMRDHQ